jgi:hypothetical protein
MAILFATGFEQNEQKPFKASAGSALVDAGGVSGAYHAIISGSASLSLGSFSETELYVGAWWNSVTSANGRFRVGANINVRIVSNRLALYRDNTLLATGTAVVNLGTYYNLQMFVKANATTGRVILRVDGLEDIDFTGNTGSGALTFVGIQDSGSGSGVRVAVDNVIVRDDDWPGDVRFVGLNPNADTLTKDWTPQTGTDNFAMVNNASDASYVETDGDGDRDLYEVANWSGAGLTPVTVVQWVRARKETADNQQVKALLVSGATESDETFDLLTSYDGMEGIIYENDPDTTALWTNGGINGITIGQEAIIP